MRERNRPLTLGVLVLALGACKSEDKADVTGQEQASGQAGATSPKEIPADQGGDTSEETSAKEKVESATPPAEDHGHIVLAGEKTELTGKDFMICETVNPGIKGDFNIISKLSDGTRFRLSGNINEDNSADHRGLVFGSMPAEVRASDLEVSLEGRVLSGTAKTEKGVVEFSFEC